MREPHALARKTFVIRSSRALEAQSASRVT